MPNEELKPYLKVVGIKHTYAICAIYEPHPFCFCNYEVDVDNLIWCWVYYDICGNPIGTSETDDFPNGMLVDKFTAENVGSRKLAEYLNRENQDFVNAWNRRANDGKR